MHKLLTPSVSNLGRPDVPPENDAVDASFAKGASASLKDDLVAMLGESQVLHRLSDLVRYASDASPYRYIPQIIVRPRNTEDMQNCSGIVTRRAATRPFGLAAPV